MGTIRSVARWAILMRSAAVRHNDTVRRIAPVFGIAAGTRKVIEEVAGVSSAAAGGGDSVRAFAAMTLFVVAGACSTPPEDTTPLGQKQTPQQNDSKAERSYVAQEPSSEPAGSTSTAIPPVSDTAVVDGGDETLTEADAGSASTRDDTERSDDSFGEAGSAAPADTTSLDHEGATSDGEGSGETSASTCRQTAGVCDPVGDCALSDCDFDDTGKSCAYTPDRVYPFMCVESADYEPYRPCDTDDACAPGSVCISKVALLKDGSFYRRPGAVCRETCRQDADCGENEWCAQATDDNNEVIPDLRVCHRHCSTESDCYVGEGDAEVRCSNSVEGAPPSTYECSRYRPPVTEEPVDPVSTGESVAQESTESSGTGTGSADATLGISLQLHLRAYSLQTQATALMACVFNEDCPANADCVNDTCQLRCTTADDCDGAECVVVNGRGICGAPCEKPEGAACGLVPSNCGCATGETCQLDGNFEATCAKPGKGAAMRWCNASDDCDTGLSCIAGLCRPLCHPEAYPCAPLAGECLLSVSREGDDVYACGGSCDPVTAPECGVGAVCVPGFDSSHHHRAMCVAERAGQTPRHEGDGCKEDFDCASGLGCDAQSTCQPWCRASSECGDGQVCKFDASIMGRTTSRFGSAEDDRVGLCGRANP